MERFFQKEYNFMEHWRTAFAADGAQGIELAKAYLQQPSARLSDEELEAPSTEETVSLLQEAPDSFQKRLDQIDNVYELQATIYTHCTILAERKIPLSAEENHQYCFRLEQILKRAAYLCSQNLFLFQGTLQSMRLRSEEEFFHAILFPWEDRCQVLTVDQTDHASLHSQSREKGVPQQTRTYTASPTAVRHLLDEVAASFAAEREDLCVYDVGTWELELTNTEGHVYLFKGYLYGESDDIQTRLSELLRETFGCKSLLAFDGNCQPEDAIRYLKLECRNPDTQAADSMQPNEWFTLDNGTGTVEWVNQRYNYGRSLHHYEFSDSLNHILRHFGKRRLFQQPKIPSGELISYTEVPLYTMTVEFVDGTRQVLTGHYDKSELPECFETLLKLLTTSLCHLDNGNMLDPATYSRARRRQGQLIYCSVSFHDGGKTYYYRTDDDSFHPGNKVVVPAGKDSHPALAKIEKVEYFAPQEVPFPVEQTKCILRRASSQDLVDIP